MATSKVNKNFVVLLVTGIVALVAGLGGTAAYIFVRSGERNIARGDAFMAAGDYGAAQKAYSRAVNRDRSRVDWLNKWKGALEKWVPPTETEYRQAYNTYYVGVLRTIALVKNRDPEAQAQYIAELDQFMRKGNGGLVEPIKTFLRDVEERIKPLNPDDNQTKRLLRYRGLARLDIMDEQPLPDDERAQALKDLQAAFEVDPNDHEVLLGIVRWHMQTATRKASARRDADADTARKEAGAALESFLKANPNQPDGLIMQMVLRQQEMLSRAVTIDDKVRVMSELRPLAEDVMLRLEQLPPEQLRTDLLWQVVGRVRTVLGDTGAKRTLALADKALTLRPTDPDLMMLAAEMTYESGDLESTFERFQRVADLKDQPVSRIGMMLPVMRRVAVGRQIDTALDQWRKAKDDDTRDAAMARAKQYRDRLKAIVDISSQDELKLREAYIAIAEGRNDIGIALLSELRAQTAKVTDHRVILPLAEALNRAGSKGDAAQMYDRLIEAGYLDAGVLSAAGLVHLDLQNIDKASDYFSRALALSPDNQALRDLASRVKQLGAAFKGDYEKMEDPVVRSILRANQLIRDGELKQARVLIEEMYKTYPTDYRVIQYYVNNLVQEENRQRALEVLDKAIADQPDNKDWPRMKVVVQNPDRDAALLALIDTGSLQEHEKLVQKYQIYARKGMKKEAEEAYARAVELAPDADGVVEMMFMRQITRIVEARAAGDITARTQAEGEAQRLAAKAAEKNLDQLQGTLYRARLLMAQEKFRDAAQLVKQALDRVPNNPQAWRLLGMAHMEAGQVNEGLNAFQRAYDGQPNNGAIAKDYARALLRVARGRDALTLVHPDTGALRFAENTNDEELVNMWLELEAQHNGPAGVANAIDQRKIIFARRPSLLPNAVSLCRLLIQADRWDEADRILNSIQKHPEATPQLTVRLRADWFAAQRRFEEGENVYKEYIGSLGDQVTVTPWLMFAAWLQQNQRLDQAIAALTEARKLQTKDFEADRQLGDLLFNSFVTVLEESEKKKARRDPDGAAADAKRAVELLERAELSYRTIIEGDGDYPASGFPVTKRLVETQIRLQRYDDAAKTLDQLKKISPPEAKIEEDLQYLLLRGSVAENQNRIPEARRVYDAAVERHPGDHRPYLSRGILNAKDPALFPDAVADFTQVTRLIPANTVAWNMLFMLHEQRGLTDQAFTLLNKAVDQNPNNDPLNKLYVERLTQAGRRDEALQHMMRMVARDTKKADPFIIRSAAQYALLSQKFREAADMYKLLLQQDGYANTENRALYLYALLKRQSPLPEKAEVGELLREISKDESAAETIAGLSLRAAAEAYLGATDKGLELSRKAYKLCETSQQVYSWYQDAVDMYWLSFKKGNQFYREIPDSRRAVQREVLERFRNVRTPVPPIMVIMEIPFRQQAGEPLPKLVEELLSLESQIKDDPPARVEMYRALNQLYYTMGDYEKALQACKDGLSIDPSEPEFNNNAAYALSKHLNRPQEALAFANNAAAVYPRSSAVLDTLGQIYLQLGQIEKAIETLTKAVDFASRPDEVVAANVHLGMARLEMKPNPDIGAARRCFERAREAHAKLPEVVRKQFDADLETLRRRVQ